MADINKLLGQLLGSGAAGGFAGGLAGGLASNMLTTKKGRKLGKKALKMGGIAAVGALAYGAFQKYNSGQSSGQLPQTQSIQQQAAPEPLVQPPENTSFLPAQNDANAQENLGLLLVRAMIAAARSDGKLDARESQAIFERIQGLDISADEQSILIEEMGREVDMDAIIAGATSPELAAEVYLASVLAIDVDTPAEQNYLAMLAARLRLPRELVRELHLQLENQAESV